MHNINNSAIPVSTTIPTSNELYHSLKDGIREQIRQYLSENLKIHCEIEGDYIWAELTLENERISWDGVSLT